MAARLWAGGFRCQQTDGCPWQDGLRAVKRPVAWPQGALTASLPWAAVLLQMDGWRGATRAGWQGVLWPLLLLVVLRRDCRRR